MATRNRCIVPFCKRTTSRFPEAAEWVCGRHWALGDKRLRKAHTLHLKQRPGWDSPYWRPLVDQIVVRASMELTR